jgi:hypothetical protein
VPAKKEPKKHGQGQGNEVQYIGGEAAAIFIHHSESVMMDGAKHFPDKGVNSE